jgi:hypothetical protein
MKIYALALLLLLTPAAAVAFSDGDPCPPELVTAIDETSPPQGNARIFCRILLANKTTATNGTSPVTFSLFSLPTPRSWPPQSFPDSLAFKLVLNDCTAGTITLTHSEIIGGIETKFAGNNFNASPTIGLGTSGTDYSYLVVTPFERYGPFINARWASVAGCTEGATVVVEGFNRGSSK